MRKVPGRECDGDCEHHNSVCLCDERYVDRKCLSDTGSIGPIEVVNTEVVGKVTTVRKKRQDRRVEEDQIGLPGEGAYRSVHGSGETDGTLIGYSGRSS